MTQARIFRIPRPFAASFALVLGIAAGPASAGAAFDLECTGPAGTYAMHVRLGDTMLSGKVTGWCLSKQALVTETWKTSWKVGTPQPRGPKRKRVIDPATGATIGLVVVKDCKEPIVPIETEEQLRRIPPCVGATVAISNLIEVD
jgi:hypothetical protein